ncbi:TetR/AcrR family transcriptional regulator [Bailinhaonella thermotolerans]|uniref:TetR/AcrR family transcriptional regulator n=1 Tax=Bailinhaonella thermotolerans TaxID=1070861 RepID=UPI00192A3989|nr:TetR/AcrR family transcriptional regulator [Bailinhaonella thermotolerans]
MDVDAENGAAGDGLRADARRNRDLIVAAARELFLEKGLDVALEEVSRRAGVGIGTLYRRFPDREALLRGVAEDNLRRLVELAETASREEPDAWHGLCRFLRGCADLRMGELSAKLEPRLHQRIRAGEGLSGRRRRVMDALLRMIAQAQADGDLRPDVGPVDIALLMTVHVYTPPHMPAGQAAGRVVEIMLNGLRPGPALPGAALPEADLLRYIDPGADGP